MAGAENAAKIAFSSVIPPLPSLHPCRFHGDADVRLGECGCIVYSVAGHCDHGAFLLAILHNLRLLLGQHIGIEFDAELVRYCLGGRRVVSRNMMIFRPAA